MSKSDNIWVKKIQEKLTNYSPEYNASDWDALKMNLPKPKGWFGFSKPTLNWLKVIVFVSATGIAAFFIVKSFPETDNYDTNKIEISEINNSQKEIRANSDSVEIIESIQAKKQHQTSLKSKNDYRILDAEKSGNSSQKVESEKSVAFKQNADDSLNKLEPENKNSADSISKNLVSKNILDSEQKDLVGGSSNSKNNFNDKPAIKQLTNKSDNTLSDGIIEKDETSTQIKSATKSNSTQPNNLETKSISKKDSNFKVKKKRKKNNRKTGATNYAARNSSRRSKNKSSFKQKSFNNKKEIKPLFIGVNSSLNYINNIQPYQPKMNISGGLTFEKFISEKSSIELGVQLHINNHNYTELIHEDDSTITFISVPNPGDSIPSLVENIDIKSIEVEKSHSMNLVYLDFPLVYNRYFIIKKELKLGASLGISNKFFLSNKIDGNKVDMSKKFYFAQAGLIGLKYQQQINKNLNLSINPFVEIPFRNVLTQNTSWVNYGLNINILFQINKTKK